jgi:hypothetical protein
LEADVTDGSYTYNSAYRSAVWRPRLGTKHVHAWYAIKLYNFRHTPKRSAANLARLVQKEKKLACEIIVIHGQGNIVTWFHCGQPIGVF